MEPCLCPVSDPIHRYKKREQYHRIQKCYSDIPIPDSNFPFHFICGYMHKDKLVSVIKNRLYQQQDIRYDIEHGQIADS